MNRALLVGIACLFLFSCRKSIRETPGRLIDQLQLCLKDSLARSVYVDLDFGKAILSKKDSLDLQYVRIPFHSTGGFVLVQTDGSGKIQRGRMVDLEGKILATKYGSRLRPHFDGYIRIHSFQGKALLSSPIEDGYITCLHSTPSAELLVEPAPQELPEVIVYSTISDDGGLSYYTLLSYGGLTGGSNTYYGSSGYTDGSGTSYGSGSTSFSYNDTYSEEKGLMEEELKSVDIETYVNREPIDLEAYLNCFDSMPDAGASYSIELFTDIPVDGDPSKIFDISSQSPGHAFIQLKKSNGDQSVIQNIGWYPATGWKSITSNAPIAGKFVDDGDHEANASLLMKLAPEDFARILTHIRYLARFIKYDIDEYNCTNFALDVFNVVRIDKLNIPLYHIPGGLTAAGSSTPQGLYTALKQLKEYGSPEASNIRMDYMKAFVAYSHGPCY